MIFDNLGLPKDNGASDWLDSARLAGIMTVFDWSQEVDCFNYILKNIKKDSFLYVRHPLNIDELLFSRDQAICLIAGLKLQKLELFVDKNFINGKDIFMPSHNGHVKRCQNRKASWFEDLWLWLDVFWNVYITPMAEQNQLLCMLMIADKKYLKFYLKHHKQWKESIRSYWSGWRKENELAEHIIKKLEYYL